MEKKQRDSQRKVLLDELDDVEFECFALLPGLGATNERVQELVARAEAIRLNVHSLEKESRAELLAYYKSPVFLIRSEGKLRPSQVDQNWVDNTFKQLTDSL